MGVGPICMVWALSVVTAACTSGPGPFSAPDISQSALVGVAAEWLASSDRLTEGPIFVLDHVDPTVVDELARADGEFASNVGERPVAVPLDDTSRRAIRDRLEPERRVFVVADRASVPMGPPRDILGHPCPSIQDGGTFVALAPLRPEISVHGDVYLVAIEHSDGCAMYRTALLLAWQSGALFGGHWNVNHVYPGAGVSP